MSRPFTVIAPSPGNSLTRATAVLRLPVPLYKASAMFTSPRILLRVLSGVRMLGARVDLQLPHLLTGEPALRHHPVDGLAHDLLGAALEHPLVARLLHAARVARVPPVHLLLGLLARDDHLLRVHHDHEVAHIDVGGVLRLVLAAQDLCDLRRQPPEGLSLGVYDVPLPFDLEGPRHVTLHQSSGVSYLLKGVSNRKIVAYIPESNS